MENDMNNNEIIYNQIETLKLLLRIQAGKIDVDTEIENIKTQLAIMGVSTDQIKA